MFDPDLLQAIRAKFPRAATDLNGRKRAFFDNGTGTLVVRGASRAEAKARVNCSANTGANFDESRKAEASVLNGRKAVADLLNAPSADTIISGESATALLFSLSYALGRAFTGKENVVATDYEHYANISPWQELKERRRIREVKFARLNKDNGTIDMDHLQELINARTKVVTVSAASNVLGTKSALKEVGKMAKEVGAHFVVDAVHHIAHGPIDVQDLNCDFLVFSGYKFFSGHGSFLYGKEDNLRTLKPYKVATAPRNPPYSWEWGTRDQSTFAAVQGVISHLVWLSNQVQHRHDTGFSRSAGRKRSLKIALDAIEKYERSLSKAILCGFDDFQGLADMREVTVYGLTDLDRLEERDPTFAFKVENRSDEQIVDHLWIRGGIATRAEDFYSRAVQCYSQETMIRISLVHYNTLQEVGAFLKTLGEVCRP